MNMRAAREFISGLMEVWMHVWCAGHHKPWHIVIIHREHSQAVHCLRCGRDTVR